MIDCSAITLRVEPPRDLCGLIIFRATNNSSAWWIFNARRFSNLVFMRFKCIANWILGKIKCYTIVDIYLISVQCWNWKKEWFSLPKLSLTGISSQFSRIKVSKYISFCYSRSPHWRLWPPSTPTGYCRGNVLVLNRYQSRCLRPLPAAFHSRCLATRYPLPDVSCHVRVNCTYRSLRAYTVLRPINPSFVPIFIITQTLAWRISLCGFLSTPILIIYAVRKIAIKNV